MKASRGTILRTLKKILAEAKQVEPPANPKDPEALTGHELTKLRQLRDYKPALQFLTDMFNQTTMTFYTDQTKSSVIQWIWKNRRHLIDMALAIAQIIDTLVTAANVPPDHLD